MWQPLSLLSVSICPLHWQLRGCRSWHALLAMRRRNAISDCIQRLGNIFPDIYWEYIRLQDRVKHSNPLLQLWHLRITNSWNNMNLPHNLLSGYIFISRLNSGSLHWHFEVATLNILWLLRNLYQLSRKKKYYAHIIYMIYFKGRRWLKFKEGGIKCKIKELYAEKFYQTNVMPK